MEEIHWVIVFLILCVLISFIASKKGRSGVKLFFAMAVPAVPLMILISYALGNNMEAKPLAMWSIAFLCPVVGFFWALMAPNQEQMARTTGEYGDMKTELTQKYKKAFMLNDGRLYRPLLSST